MANTTEVAALNAFRKRLAAIAETDIAWFSGWLSADGSVKSADRLGRPAIRFQICDRDPLDRIAELFGNRVGGPFAQSKKAFGKRPLYEWKITGSRAVALLVRCMPWLSCRYAARARKALKYSLRSHCGRKLSPDDVVAIRARLAVGGHGIGRRLAEEYGITDGMISAIRHGRSW